MYNKQQGGNFKLNQKLLSILSDALNLFDMSLEHLNGFRKAFTNEA